MDIVLVKGHTEEDLKEYDNGDDYRIGKEEPDDHDDYSYDYVADEAEGDYDFSKNRGKSTTSSSITTTTPTTTSTTSTTTRTYDGDYEDVDDHIRRNKEKGTDDIHDICSETFDSMAVIRNELFVFLGMKMWRFSDRGVLRFQIFC